jgi:hypothetical protein
VFSLVRRQRLNNSQAQAFPFLRPTATSNSQRQKRTSASGLIKEAALAVNSGSQRGGVLG